MILQIEKVNGDDALIARLPGTTGPEDVSFGGYLLRKERTLTDELVVEAAIIVLGHESLVAKLRFPKIMTDQKSRGKLYFIERTNLVDGTVVEKITEESEVICRRKRDI